MTKVTVGLDERSYQIYIDTGTLSQLGELCRQSSLKGRVAIVTNPVVSALYLARTKTSLESAGYRVTVIEIPDGEEYKCSATLEIIYDRLIEAEFDRSSLLVALGGGVIGDITGYAAATFLRGVPFVQVPTTLLSQVDSSVGGKTGINHRLGKNLIGAFYQPRLVLIDLDTLDTLPEREYHSGLAEVLKYGIVLERGFFEFISGRVEAIRQRDKAVLRQIVATSCRIKADVVEKDEKEGGLRVVLNYGHTIGHAVETLAGYGALRHGEAVAIGIAQAARLSESKGFSTSCDCKKITDLLESLGFSIEMPDFSLDEYLRIICHDKKKRDDGVNFIFNQGIGDFVIENVADLRSLLEIARL